MIEVVATDVFETWYLALDAGDTTAVTEAVEYLRRKGVALGYPRSSNIKGSRLALRELRIQSHGRPLRVFYAFDPLRQAVLLLGADKTGQKRFYREKIREAEALFVAYLAAQKMS